MAAFQTSPVPQAYQPPPAPQQPPAGYHSPPAGYQSPPAGYQSPPVPQQPLAASAAYQLPPVPQPLALFNHMMALQTTTLVLKERSFDDFDINDLSGARWMHIEGQIATMHGRKKVFDPRGNYLFDIVKELFHWHATFNCKTETEPQRQYMQVKSKFSIFSSKANATFTSTTGAPVTLSMKGNWLDTTAEIVDPTTGAVAARIDRKLFNARELLLGRQTYHVTIAPGVDIALIIAMCVCLDEAQNEGQKNACTIL